MNKPNPLFEELGIKISEEEQRVLDSLQEKINNHLKNPNLEKIHEENRYDPLEDPVHPRHVTDYPRELRIMISIEMSSIDQNTRMLKELDLVFQNWYHIPILENTDYTTKANQFIDALEQETNALAHKIHPNEESKQPKE